MAEILRVGVGQLAAEPYAVKENLTRFKTMAEEAAGEGAELLIGPEGAITGYEKSLKMMGLAETLEGRVVTEMREAAGRLGMAIGWGMLEKNEKQKAIFNSFLIVQPNGEIVVHRKGRTPAGEGIMFEPNKDNDYKQIIELRGGKKIKAGMLICAEAFYWSDVNLALLGEERVEMLLVILANRYGIWKRVAGVPRNQTEILGQELSKLGLPVAMAAMAGKGFGPGTGVFAAGEKIKEAKGKGNELVVVEVELGRGEEVILPAEKGLVSAPGWLRLVAGREFDSDRGKGRYNKHKQVIFGG